MKAVSTLRFRGGHPCLSTQRIRFRQPRSRAVRMAANEPADRRHTVLGYRSPPEKSDGDRLTRTRTPLAVNGCAPLGPNALAPHNRSNMPTLDAKQVTDEQIEKFGTLIYDRTGIRISPQKKSLLSNRLRRRLRATEIACFEEYYQLLRRLKADDPEWDAFLQEITTHETYLFRDPNHWQWLNDSFLPQIQQEAQSGLRSRHLRVWSAACSNGDEAYTVACCVAAKLSHPAQWNVEIVGTDIGIDAVKQARAGVFNARSMKLVPADLRRRFFTPEAEGAWSAKPMLKAWVNFRQHNLIQPFEAAPFDLIFLKNVMIYFDRDSKQKVIGHLERLLKPGGRLVSGPAEGVAGLLDRFEREKPWLHTKPATPPRTGIQSRRGTT